MRWTVGKGRVKDGKKAEREELVTQLEDQINELRELHRKMQEVVNDLRDEEEQ